MRGFLRFVPLVIAGLLAATPAAAQAPKASSDGSMSPTSSAAAGASASTKPKIAQNDMPVDLERVKEQAERQPAIKLDEERLRFYVLVLATAPKQVTWKDIVGNYDLMNGPTKGGAPMTHSEFMTMTRPRVLDEMLFGTSGGASGAFALVQAQIMNAAGQALVTKAINAMQRARSEREIQDIRDRIERELAALAEKDQKD